MRSWEKSEVDWRSGRQCFGRIEDPRSWRGDANLPTIGAVHQSRIIINFPGSSLSGTPDGTADALGKYSIIIPDQMLIVYGPI